MEHNSSWCRYSLSWLIDFEYLLTFLGHHYLGNGAEVTEGFRNFSESRLALQHPRSKLILVMIESITPSCQFSKNFSIKWQVLFLGINSNVNASSLLIQSDSFLVPNSTIAFANGSHVITFPCCMVHYCSLVVSVEVCMNGGSLVGGFKTSKLF